jgi:hypothetical protein
MLRWHGGHFEKSRHSLMAKEICILDLMAAILNATLPQYLFESFLTWIHYPVVEL